jgi:hypothetical protein
MTDEDKTGHSSPELFSSPAPPADRKSTGNPPPSVSDSSATPSVLQSAWPSSLGPQTDKDPRLQTAIPAEFDPAWPSTSAGSSSLDSQQDRAALVSRARQFLTSANVAPAPVLAKRTFLIGKGLNPSEADALLHELVSVLNAFFFSSHLVTVAPTGPPCPPAHLPRRSSVKST